MLLGWHHHRSGQVNALSAQCLGIHADNRLAGFDCLASLHKPGEAFALQLDRVKANVDEYFQSSGRGDGEGVVGLEHHVELA